MGTRRWPARTKSSSAKISRSLASAWLMAEALLPSRSAARVTLASTSNASSVTSKLASTSLKCMACNNSAEKSSLRACYYLHYCFDKASGCPAREPEASKANPADASASQLAAVRRFRPEGRRIPVACRPAARGRRRGGQCRHRLSRCRVPAVGPGSERHRSRQRASPGNRLRPQEMHQRELHKALNISAPSPTFSSTISPLWRPSGAPTARRARS